MYNNESKMLIAKPYRSKTVAMEIRKTLASINFVKWKLETH